MKWMSWATKQWVRFFSSLKKWVKIRFSNRPDKTYLVVLNEILKCEYKWGREIRAADTKERNLKNLMKKIYGMNGKDIFDLWYLNQQMKFNNISEIWDAATLDEAESLTVGNALRGINERCPNYIDECMRLVDVRKQWQAIRYSVYAVIIAAIALAINANFFKSLLDILKHFKVIG